MIPDINDLRYEKRLEKLNIFSAENKKFHVTQMKFQKL